MSLGLNELILWPPMWWCLVSQGHYGRADFRHAPSQWDTSLQSNPVSHWHGRKPRNSHATALTVQGIWSLVFNEEVFQSLSWSVNKTHSRCICLIIKMTGNNWRDARSFKAIRRLISPYNTAEVAVVDRRTIHARKAVLFMNPKIRLVEGNN